MLPRVCDVHEINFKKLIFSGLVSTVLWNRVPLLEPTCRSDSLEPPPREEDDMGIVYPCSSNRTGTAIATELSQIKLAVGANVVVVRFFKVIPKNGLFSREVLHEFFSVLTTQSLHPSPWETWRFEIQIVNEDRMDLRTDSAKLKSVLADIIKRAVSTEAISSACPSKFTIESYVKGNI